MGNEWMNEKIDHIYKNNWIYKIACFLIGRKMTYSELFWVYSNINEKHLGKEKSKEESFKEIIKIYEYLNNKRPYDIKEDESK